MSGHSFDSGVPSAFRGRSFRLPIGRMVTIFVVIAVAAVVLALGFSVVQRVDPGYTAIVVDYGAGTESGKAAFRQAPTGSFFLVNPLTQLVAKYPLAQQTLSMVRRQAEGKVQGDDSVECNDIAGVRINIDSSTLWRVNPPEAGQLYFLRPGIPLTGSSGNDVEDLIVRRDVCSSIVAVCGTMSYDAIFGAERLQFGDKVKALLDKNLAQQHILVDSFLVGEVYLQPELAKAIA